MAHAVISRRGKRREERGKRREERGKRKEESAFANQSAFSPFSLLPPPSSLLLIGGVP
jgi:hypothetical protein